MKTTASAHLVNDEPYEESREVSLNHAESHLDFVEENIRDLHGRIGAETTLLKSNYDHSQVNDTESMQFDVMMENIRAQESGYEV